MSNFDECTSTCYAHLGNGRYIVLQRHVSPNHASYVMAHVGTGYVDENTDASGTVHRRIVLEQTEGNRYLGHTVDAAALQDLLPTMSHGQAFVLERDIRPIYPRRSPAPEEKDSTHP